MYISLYLFSSILLYIFFICIMDNEDSLKQLKRGALLNKTYHETIIIIYSSIFYI